MSKKSSFNRFLTENYDYNLSDEEEIKSQIYSHRNTTEFTSIITILKNNQFRTKVRVKPIVIGGNIYLNVTILYFEDVPDYKVKRLLEDLTNQTKKNILLDTDYVDKKSFESIRIHEYVKEGAVLWK